MRFGGRWGGLLLLNPLGGLVVGAGLGAASAAVSTSLADYGIPDSFIRQLAGTIEPNSSALFILFRKINADKLLPELAQLQGRVLRTSLSDADEKRLHRALAEAQEKAA